ncbi:MAG: hypothetical protein AAF612_04500 [Planctomycetota bacterium]
MDLPASPQDILPPAAPPADAPDTPATPEAEAHESTPDPPDPPGHRKRLVLCPYCGALGSNREQCGSCGGLFEPMSRKATQVAMGAWFVRDPANPFRPGCSIATLRGMITAGRVGPTTVIRGPTTRQFWSIARNVPGVSHLVGYCCHCGAKVDPHPEPDRCPVCERTFRYAGRRNHMGLMYDTAESLARARQDVERASEDANPATDTTLDDGPIGPPPTNGVGLLASVFNLGKPGTQP